MEAIPGFARVIMAAPWHRGDGGQASNSKRYAQELQTNGRTSKCRGAMSACVRRFTVKTARFLRDVLNGNGQRARAWPRPAPVFLQRISRVQQMRFGAPHESV